MKLNIFCKSDEIVFLQYRMNSAGIESVPGDFFDLRQSIECSTSSIVKFWLRIYEILLSSILLLDCEQCPLLIFP